MPVKVMLPKEVAEGLNMLLETGAPNIEIISTILGNAVHPKQMALVKYVNSGGFTNIMFALVNGFEIKETPEDKVREYYNLFKKDDNVLAQHVIGTTLDLLNIKISGVNA